MLCVQCTSNAVQIHQLAMLVEEKVVSKPKVWGYCERKFFCLKYTHTHMQTCMRACAHTHTHVRTHIQNSKIIL
jgi:hypothetical protein